MQDVRKKKVLSACTRIRTGRDSAGISRSTCSNVEGSGQRSKARLCHDSAELRLVEEGTGIFKELLLLEKRGTGSAETKVINMQTRSVLQIEPEELLPPEEVRRKVQQRATTGHHTLVNVGTQTKP